MTFGGKSINHPRSAAGCRRPRRRHRHAAAAYLRRLIRRRRRARAVPWLLVAWFWLCGWQAGMRGERELREGEMEIGK